MSTEQHASTTTAPLTNPTRKLKWSRVMRWVRRIHLYSGMLMFPWVLLYGTTAFLFNHPGCLPDKQPDPIAIAPEHLAAIPDPKALAQDLLDELKAKGAVERVSAPREARYAGDLSLKQRDADREHLVVVDMESRRATKTTRPRDPALPPAPFAQKDWFPAGKPIDTASQSIGADLRRRDLGEGPIAVRSAPKLRFRAVIDGVDWELEYALQQGSLTAMDNANEPLSLRRFVLRLHKTHRFPRHIGPRLLWAMLVDAMFLTMMFWAMSGLLMCLQMKRVRRIGLAVLGLGLVGAAILVFLMSRVLR